MRDFRRNEAQTSFKKLQNHVKKSYFAKILNEVCPLLLRKTRNRAELYNMGGSKRPGELLPFFKDKK